MQRGVNLHKQITASMCKSRACTFAAYLILGMGDFSLLTAATDHDAMHITG